MSPQIKKLFIFATLSLFIETAGVICNAYSIGINHFIDTVARWGVPLGCLMAIIALFWLLGLFIAFLVKRKFDMAGYCGFTFLGLLLSFAIIIPPLGLLPKSYLLADCAKNLQSVGQIIMERAISNKGEIPSADWCDTLIMEFKLEPQFLCCRSSRHGYFRNNCIGESSYALNSAIVDQNFLSLSPDIVVVFETDTAEDSNQTISASERKSGDFLYGDKEVNLAAWNQTGGLSIVSCGRHVGLGCNILFADGHVEFVKKKNIPSLRWKP